MKTLFTIIVFNLLFFVSSFGYVTSPADTVLADTYYAAGDSFLILKDYQKSIAYFEKAAAIYKKNDAWIKYANCQIGVFGSYERMGEFTKAIDLAENILPLLKNKLGVGSLQEGYAYLSIGSSYYSLSKNDLAVENLQKAEKILESHDSMEYRLAIVHYNLGKAYVRNRRSELSTRSFRKALDTGIQLWGKEDLRVAAYYNSLGLAYHYAGHFDAAIEFYEEALRIKKIHNKYLASTYGNLGLTYLWRGDLDIALRYFNKAIELNENVSAIDYNMSHNYHNLGVAYTKMGDYERALRSYHSGLNILRNKYNGKDVLTEATMYNDMGHIFFETNVDSADYYFQKALKIRKDNLKSTHPDLAASYSSLAKLAVSKSQYQLALSYYNKSLEAQKAAFGEKQPTLSWTYFGIGDVESKMKNYRKALTFYQAALCAQVIGFSDTSIHAHPPLKGFFVSSDYLNHYQAKASAFRSLYYSEQDRGHLVYSLEVYQKCDTLIDHIRQSHLKYVDKVSVGKVSKLVYEGAIQVCLELYDLTKDKKYLHQAFHFSERSKAGALVQALSDISARTFGHIPDALLAMEKNLKIDIAQYQSQLLEEKNNRELDSANIRFFENKLFNANRSYDSLVRALEKSYPQYYALKYKSSAASLQLLQQKLGAKAALIEYFVGDSSIYVFTVTNNKFNYQIIRRDSSLNQLTRQLRASLNPRQVHVDPFGAHQGFVQSAGELYRRYLQEALKNISSEVTKLIIIPDGELGYIPFEVLLTEEVKGQENDYSSFPYLLKKYQISYGYSATLLLEDPIKKRSARAGNYNYLAFAPVYKGGESDSVRSLSLGRFRDQVTALSWNIPEVNNIGRYLSGSSFTGEEAVESRFKQLADKYSIIHLAMHALVDDQRPMYSKLVFTDAADSIEDGFLHAYELYNMELPAEMVVLSACETGYGKLEKGEGIMSLARAFSYAGCPSVVMSHWLADDEATAKLMELFYKNLAKGLDKDAALREAKLEYLNESEVLKRHPAFWAGFVMLGDTSPIGTESFWERYWVYGLVIVLLAVLWFYRRRFRTILSTQKTHFL